MNDDRLRREIKRRSDAAFGDGYRPEPSDVDPVPPTGGTGVTRPLDAYAENIRAAERERIVHGIRKYLGRLIWSEEDIDLLLRHSDVGLEERSPD